MSLQIQFLTSITGEKISIVFCQQTNQIWISAKEIAMSLGYANTRSAIARYVSPLNKQPLTVLLAQTNTDIKIPPGLQKNTIFINYQGFCEFTNSKPTHPSIASWVNIFASAKSTEKKELPYLDVSGERELDTDSKKVAFKGLEEIPETVANWIPAHGYVYLLKWNQFGKVGKTRSLVVRKQSLQQQFKESEIVWFCFCQNIDVLEREILEKLRQLSALVKVDGSTEIFDPAIVSFDTIQKELKRLCIQINRQYNSESERLVLKQTYLEFAKSLVPFLDKNSDTSIEIIQELLVGFRNL
jgi:hypothetical protein